MAARVAIEGISQIGSERRVLFLVLYELGFCGEGKSGGEIFQTRHVESDALRVQFLSIEFVARKQFGQKGPQLLELVRFNRGGVWKTGVAHEAVRGPEPA